MSVPSTGECRTILENISASLDGELDATACGDRGALPGLSDRCWSVDGLRRTVGLCPGGVGAAAGTGTQRARDSVRELLDREAAANWFACGEVRG